MKNNSFQKLANSGFLYSLYLLKNLPMAFLAGIRVKKLTDSEAQTLVKYKWLNTNPFRSMYFAVLAMAAEMSTGVLLINGVFNSSPPVSMLVVKNSAEYFKKAVGKITFTCSDGKLISDSIAKAKETKQGILIEATTVGKDESDDIVATFVFVWSIKVKS